MQSRLTILVCLILAGMVPGLKAFETVVVDPGHGGNDEGTKWYHVAEKDVSLAVANRLTALLRSHGINVIQTRTDDSYVSLIERAEIANRAKNSLLVSVHFNSSGNGATSGFQTYHFAASPSSQVVAQSIQETLAAKLGRRSRGVMKNDFAVLTRTTDLAVLVECGFISNKQEAMYYASDAGQQSLAAALAAGILRVKPVINLDPPACEIAKCAIVAKRDAAAARKRLLSGATKEESDTPEPLPPNDVVAAKYASASWNGANQALDGLLNFKLPAPTMPSFAFMLREVLAAYDDGLGSE